jgi:hypothetical protein
MPVAGSYAGASGVLAEMHVDIAVTADTGLA